MAGISAQPRDFQQIANSCAQVGTSLTEHGEHDGRQLWRAMLTLAFFCEDACDWSHEVGSLHPTYDQAKTDAEVGRIVAEHARKSFGAPLCTSLDAERPGVCATCPHLGNVTTPYQLGLQAAAPTAPHPNTLPWGYRRNNGWLEHQRKNKKDEYVWARIVECNITDPVVDLVDAPTGMRTRLTFTCNRQSQKGARLSVYHDDLLNLQTGHAVLSVSSVYLGFFNARGFLELLMAWIEQLTRFQPAEKQLPSFGWAAKNGAYAGIGVGGTYYDPTGREIEAPNADRKLIERYTPQGTLAAWQQAATFVAGKVPELHTAIAASLGAPLMKLAGENGGCIAFVGPSGAGKSSAFIAGAAVWGDPLRTMISLDDTYNAQGHMLGQTRVMPLYWDEAKVVAKDRQAELVTMLHKLTQGRDKARLTSSVQLREGGEWNTLFPLATNNSVTDLIASQDGHKSATLVRVLEIEVPDRKIPGSQQATRIISNLKLNYGHAGRTYAKYLGQNVPSIEAEIDKIADAVRAAIAPYEAEERFYVSIAACIIVGAMLARRLGLIQLDVKGIAKVLVDAILRARHERHALEPKNPLDTLAQVFAQFIQDHMDACVVTRRFSRRGTGHTIAGKLEEYSAPIRKLPTPAFHLAVEDEALRFDVRYFRTWCIKLGQPASWLLQQMGSTWNAVGDTRGPWCRHVVSEPAYPVRRNPTGSEPRPPIPDRYVSTVRRHYR